MINIKISALKIRRRILSYFWSPDRLKNLKGDRTFKLPDGSKFYYPSNSSIGQSLLIGGFEISEVEFMRQALKPGDTVIDIGANGGLFAVIAAKKVGSNGHVYACEPGLRELELLRHNIAINNLDNVTIIESAIGDRNKVAELAISDDGAMNSLSKTNHPSQKIESWQTVEMITLDALVEQFNLSKIDLIKIDVEGAENLVIDGAKQTLSSSMNPIIMFESSDVNASSFGYSVKDFLNNLRRSELSIQYINKFGALKDVSIDNPEIGQEIYNFIAFKKSN
jgi:FkbM family methyltransferase